MSTIRCNFLIFLKSGYQIELKSRASYIVVGMWLLLTVVLANAYAGVLFSFLSVARLEPIINSLAELADSKDVQLIINDRLDFTNRLLVSSIFPSNWKLVI